ncbi:MAG: hypothetical protein E7604_09595 [Ruminococcaceae bacterium]|nr:hypothetical protein [Oscillospiraceae bacterium]
MKRKKILSAILIILGIVPFAVALICGLPIFRASNLTYGDFLILYSYLFWPTYILGAVLLAAGIIWRIALKRTHKTGDS